MSQEEEISILPNDNSSSLTANTSTDQSLDGFRVNIPQLDIIDPPQKNHLTYGKLYAFYYIDNEPMFAIGPDWPYFACMFTLNIIMIIFLMYILYLQSYTSVFLLGVALSLIQLGSYLFTAIINPGLPKSNYEQLANRALLKINNNGNGNKNGDVGYRKCKECNLWICINTKSYHCYDCGVCFEGYDHHCPWTTKCVAGGNVNYFYYFLLATFVLFAYFVFAVIMMR